MEFWIFMSISLLIYNIGMMQKCSEWWMRQIALKLVVFSSFQVKWAIVGTIFPGTIDNGENWIRSGNTMCEIQYMIRFGADIGNRWTRMEQFDDFWLSFEWIWWISSDVLLNSKRMCEVPRELAENSRILSHLPWNLGFFDKIQNNRTVWVHHTQVSNLYTVTSKCLIHWKQATPFL